jgi:glutamine amidotransferase
MILSILDIGCGNIGSLKNALDFLNIENKIIRNISEIQEAESLILPGDGSFKILRSIYEKGFLEPLNDHIKKNKPLLGICLGMQLFANRSEEDIDIEGFGWIPGKVKKIISKVDYKVPHIGYNSINIQQPHETLLGIKNNSDFYFVHSYFYEPDFNEHILALTDYSIKFCSIIGYKNIIGTQFHPEKSQENGLLFLKNFYNFSEKFY